MKGMLRGSAAAIGLGLTVSLLGMGVASADPTLNGTAGNTNTYDRPLQGEGSDTIEGVMNGLSDAIVGGTTNSPLISSYNALSGTTFQTKPSTYVPPQGSQTAAPAAVGTNCQFYGNPGTTPVMTTWAGGTVGGNPADPAGSVASGYVERDRANGSGNGKSALNSSWLNVFTAAGATNPSRGCIDFARSSSAPSAITNGISVTGIPLATDAVSFAVTGTTQLGRQLSLADLKAMYQCTYPGFDNAAGTATSVTTPSTYAALLPQAGSGTRKFFLAQLGLTDPGTTLTYPTGAGTGVANTGCISDQKTHSGLGGSNFIEEHKGNVLDDKSIVPISVAQYISQSEGIITDYRGRAILGSIVDQGNSGTGANTSWSLPMSMNPNLGSVSTNPVVLSRTVYNVIPSDVLGLNPAAGSPNMLTSTITSDKNYATQVQSVFANNGATAALLCNAQAQSIIQKYGFAINANCGNTTAAGGAVITAGQ